MEVFLDLLPNQPRNDATREDFRRLFRERWEERLDDSVERVWDLPAIIVQPRGEYLPLLLEARELCLAEEGCINRDCKGLPLTKWFPDGSSPDLFVH
jgi:hypothetical protein